MAITSLLLLMLGFLCVLQVNSSASLPQPIKRQSTQSDEDGVKILEFHKFATEDQEMLSIKRVDLVDTRTRLRCIIVRLLSIPEYTFGRKRGWTNISQESEIDDDRKKWQSRYIKLDLMPESGVDVPSNEDLSQMFKDVHETESVLRQYMDSLVEKKMEEPILDFFDKDEKEPSHQLAEYILPLANNIFKYDIAIDYITKEYREHCLNGIVQQNKLYYLKLLWNSVKGQDKDDLIWLEAFMATACPFPDAISDHETLEPIPKKELLAHLGKSEDLKVMMDFGEQKVTKVEEVEPLWAHLPMIKDSIKNSDLIGELEAGFGQYKNMGESDMKAHDEDLWVGYQKKFIVLQTIIKVMPEGLKKKSFPNNLPKVPENDLINDPINDTINGSINDPINDTISDPINGPIKDTISDPINDTISDPINGSIKDPINGSINDTQYGATKKWYDNAVFNLAKRHPYWAFGGTVVALALGYYAFFGSEDPTVSSESFTNATTSPKSADVDDGAWIAWLIVGVTIIVAILILCFVCCLIRRKKSRKRNHDDDDSEDKTSSKTTTGNTSTSTGPSSSPESSRPKSTTASLVTSPLRSPTLIRSRISAPGPVKSALGKPPSISSPTSSIHSSHTSSYFGASSAHSSAASSFSAVGGNSSAWSSTGGGGSTLSAASSGGGGSVGSVFVGSSFAGSNVAGSSAAPSSATSHVDSSTASKVTSLSSIFSGAGSRVPKVAKSKAASPKAASPKAALPKAAPPKAAPPAKTPKAPIPPKVQPGAKSPLGKSPQPPKVSPPPVKQSPTKVSKAATPPPEKAPTTSPSKGTTITKPGGSGDPKGVQKKKK